MLISGVKSRPVYGELSPDPQGTRHILVGEGQGAEALIRLYEQWGECRDDGDPCYPPREILYLASAESGQRLSGDMLRLTPEPTTLFPTRQTLEQALRQTLVSAHMGTRLYVAGMEGFIWAVVGIAREAGMSEDEIQMERRGSLARPVSCVHCKTTHPRVTTNIYQCPGCGLHLLVRDHFSRRLGAYQAVCVDAEAPGVLPEVEEIYP